MNYYHTFSRIHHIPLTGLISKRMGLAPSLFPGPSVRRRLSTRSGSLDCEEEAGPVSQRV